MSRLFGNSVLMPVNLNTVPQFEAPPKFLVCENACNSDPIRVLCMSLINHVNRLAGKGSRSLQNFIFSNEINALGEISGGVIIGGVFTHSARRWQNGRYRCRKNGRRGSSCRTMVMQERGWQR
jgi:hypothetical protein